MEDVLDLGEERRRGPATSVRTDAGPGGGLGPEFGGWGGATPPARSPEAPPCGLSLAAGAGGPGVALRGGRRGGGGLPAPPPPASGASGKCPRFALLSGAPSANSPRKDGSEGGRRGPGQGRPCTYSRAFPSDFHAAIHVGTEQFYSWKAGRRTGRTLFLHVIPTGRWASPQSHS